MILSLSTCTKTNESYITFNIFWLKMVFEIHLNTIIQNYYRSSFEKDAFKVV